MIPLSIIIVSFNTKEITKRCLLSLKKNFTKYPIEYEIIVVDNNSKDGSSEMLLDLKKEYLKNTSLKQRAPLQSLPEKRQMLLQRSLKRLFLTGLERTFQRMLRKKRKMLKKEGLLKSKGGHVNGSDN